MRVREFGQRAHAVAAHLGLRTVGVQDAHADVGRFRAFEQDQPVAADRMLAVAQSNGRFGQRTEDGALAVIDEYEIVAGA